LRTKTLLTVRDPGAAADLLATYVSVGVDGVVVNMPDVADLDKVAQTGETLRKAVTA